MKKTSNVSPTSHPTLLTGYVVNLHCSKTQSVPKACITSSLAMSSLQHRVAASSDFPEKLALHPFCRSAAGGVKDVSFTVSKVLQQKGSAARPPLMSI